MRTRHISNGMNIRPSNRIIALAIAAVGIVTAIVGWRGGGETQREAQDDVAVVDRSITITETDTYGDGLKDWEEALWQTDPRNPDSDGDGIPDGEAIYSSRRLAESTDGTAPSGDATSGTDVTNLTGTEKFSRSLLSRLLLFQGAGISVTDPSVLSSLVSSLSEMFGAQGKNQYGRADITVVAVTDAAVRAYGNKMAAAIETAGGDVPESFATSGTSNTAEITLLAEAQELTLQQFLGASVPENAVVVHLALVNA